MVKNYYKIFFILSIAFICSIFCASSHATQSISVVALTWNMGNKAAQDPLVDDLIKAIKTNGAPDVIMLGTQEELAEASKQLNNKLLAQLKKRGTKYTLIENSHKTSAGAGNAAKTAAVSILQTTRLSKALNLPQNRTSLSIFVKEGYAFKSINKEIYYPPEIGTGNNTFIVIEGDLQKVGDPNVLSIAASSVHLNSFSDKTRRLHANVFFQNHFESFPNYADLLKEAKRFDVIMGDFNEREYLMKDSSVVDRGYLTNFGAYGYDFSQAQEKPSHVYGTYGFTDTFGTVSRFLKAAPIKDPRDRPHNAKGGFLDRITFTSGLFIESPFNQYGAVLDPKKFKQGKKILYSRSDHLPVVRYFKITMAKGDMADDRIVKRYILRRLPNFAHEIADIQKLTNLENPTRNQLQSAAKSLMFYDIKDTPDQFLEKFSPLKSSKDSATLFVNSLKEKEEELKKLQQSVKDLQDKINTSQDPKFLLQVYNKFTSCNRDRNEALERIDDKKSTLKWYVPTTLPESSFHCYDSVVRSLLTPAGG